MILYNYVSFQNGNFSKWKELAPRGSEFFPLRAVPKGMEESLLSLKVSSFECHYFITHVRILRNGSYASADFDITEQTQHAHYVGTKRCIYYRDQT